MTHAGDNVLDGTQALAELPNTQSHNNANVPTNNGGRDSKKPADYVQAQGNAKRLAGISRRSRSNTCSGAYIS
jgi:hypothetical protein